MKPVNTFFPAVFILLMVGCAKTDIRENGLQNDASLKSTTLAKPGNALAYKNVRSKVVKYKAEYITTGSSGKIGQTLFFKDVGNKRLGDDFVPGDPRRNGRTNITYTVDNETTTDNGLTFEKTTEAIGNAMKTWEAVKCSDLNITKVSFNGNLGFVSASAGFGGDPQFVADIQHSGFLRPSFFDLFAPGGSNFILAITFTLIWVDENGVPTDIDSNGLFDVAFRETYYNDGFDWSTNGTGFDIETIALHESGHGLSQAHFGKGFITNNNNKLHFAPRTVMNAAYSGIQRTLTGSDIGGHCSNWANWPNG